MGQEELFCKKASDFSFDKIERYDSNRLRNLFMVDDSRFVQIMRATRIMRKRFGHIDLESYWWKDYRFTDKLYDIHITLEVIDPILEKLGYYRDNDYLFCIWDNLLGIAELWDTLCYGKTGKANLYSSKFEEIITFKKAYGELYETRNPTEARDKLFSFFDEVLTSAQSDLLKNTIAKAGTFFSKYFRCDEKNIALSEAEKDTMNAAMNNLMVVYRYQFIRLLETI